MFDLALSVVVGLVLFVSAVLLATQQFRHTAHVADNGWRRVAPYRVEGNDDSEQLRRAA